MKPLRTFMFFLAVALFLLLLTLLIPGRGIRIAPGLHLTFMDLSDLTPRESGSGDRKVEELLSASTVTEDPEADFIPRVPLPDPVSARISLDSFGDSFAGSSLDSSWDLHGTPSGRPSGDSALLRPEQGPPVPYVAPANADSLRRVVRSIEFPEEGPSVLEPFFRKLNGLLAGELARTRILHFGDSQIENDRMTALIRYRLQRQFGGTGTGLVQAVPLYSASLAYRQQQEGDWLRYTFFGTRDSSVRHNAYGIMGAFTSVPQPAGGQEREKDSGWPWLEYEFNQARRTGTVDRVRVFLHAYTRGGELAFSVNDSIRDTVRQISSGFSVADLNLPVPIERIRLSARLSKGGRIYGISFESHRGLQVDNIAMRGGSGLIFTKMNREQQLRMMEYLAPGMLILQYGGNVVPYIDAGRYGRKFRQELAFLKDLCPGVPILVVGPSDMSLKEKGAFVTYPGVEPVRDALRRAALESGVAFWDLYEAMGGRNSMPTFVHADPPLASTDYVHFTALGVNLVAEMFYNALMEEYQRYLSR